MLPHTCQLEPILSMRTHHSLIALLAALFFAPALQAAIPADCRQLIVSIADTWDSSSGQLQRFERTSARAAWQPVGAPIRVLFGKNGLGWGLGVAGQNETGRRKIEGDNRAPAGIFALGKIYTDETALPRGADYPFHTVTPADAWIENPEHPQYNRHVRIADPANPPAWFKKEQMRQNDPAHRWKIEILHNTNPPIPGAGSAIFFHIWRGPNRHSAGCTTMPQDQILEIIRWLRTDADPHYVLLPAAEYTALEKSWQLPPR